MQLCPQEVGQYEKSYGQGAVRVHEIGSCWLCV
jgi:hypothetical protein